MTILDTFYILFKADSKDATKGIQQVEQSLKGFTNTVLGSLAGIASLSTVISHFKSAFDFGEELSQNARLLNVNVTDLQAWGNAVELAGGSANSFQQSLKSISEHFNTNSQVALKVLPRLADAFSRLNRAQSFRYGKSLGLDENTILLLQQGRREVEDVIRRQKELKLITEQDAESYLKLKLATKENELATRSLFNTLAIDAIPILTLFYKTLTKGFDYLSDHKDLVKGTFVAIGAGVAFMTAAFIRANPYIAGITLAISAFALVYEDFVKFIKGEGNTVIGSLVDQFKKVDEAIGRQAEKVQDFISKHFGEQYTIRFGRAKEGLGISNENSNFGRGALLNNNTNSSSRNLSIGVVNINTQATDAKGISTDFYSELKQQLFHANSYADDGVSA